MSSGQRTHYSWHQSHDQATVLLSVPYDEDDADILIVIERNQILAGVRGQPPIVKGRLYGNVLPASSVWKLEPRGRNELPERRRTSSTASSSSYAFVSDPEEGETSIGTSFAASLASDSEDFQSPPVLPSPLAEGRFPRQRLISRVSYATVDSSRPVSPGVASSSYSSLESSSGQRLLTLHLEKEGSAIWPSLIVGPVAESLSASIINPTVYKYSHELEHSYNMDPTSLVLIGLELYDIKGHREDAFEYFLRAWHHARLPAATMRLVSHYLPWHLPLEEVDSEYSTMEAEKTVASSQNQFGQQGQARRGTPVYYLQCIGGLTGVAELYHEAGLLHLDGAASTHRSRTAFSSSLSSIRIDDDSELPPARFDKTKTPKSVPLITAGTTAWLRDREYAIKYFDRARELAPDMNVPTLDHMVSGEDESEDDSDGLEMPYMNIELHSGQEAYSVRKKRAKEQKEKELALTNSDGRAVPNLDSGWYVENIIPGILGAGTAILFIGVVGALSLSTWRRNQSS